MLFVLCSSCTSANVESHFWLLSGPVGIKYFSLLGWPVLSDKRGIICQVSSILLTVIAACMPGITASSKKEKYIFAEMKSFWSIFPLRHLIFISKVCTKERTLAQGRNDTRMSGTETVDLLTYRTGPAT